MELSVRRLNVLMIDPDAETRAKLKMAARALDCFGNIDWVKSWTAALDALDNNLHIDVVFISHIYPRDEIVEFVASAKETRSGRLCAYIQIIEQDEKIGETVAQNVIKGIDGFLCEPFSATGLRETTEVGRSVKNKQIEARLRGATELLITSMVAKLDSTASSLKRGDLQEGDLKEQVLEAKSLLEDINQDGWATYYEILMESFEKVVARYEVDTGYHGVSKRLQKRLKEKMLQELAKKDES